MTAQEYLEQVKSQDRRVKMMRTKLRMLREALDLKGVSYESDGSKVSSRQTDKMAEAIGRIIDYEKEVKEEEAKLTILRFEAEKAIQSLEDSNEREVLERMYLLFQPVDVIKKEMQYSRSSIFEFRKKGVENLEKSGLVWTVLD